MAELNEELVGKLVAMAEGFQSLQAQVQQAAQDSSQAVQTAKQTAQSIAETVGSLQSDFASRFLTKADIDMADEERMRATGARDDAYLAFKTNVNDFDKAGDLRSQDKDIRELKSQLNKAHLDILQRSIDHYSSVLSDERTAKYGSDFYRKNLKAQTLAHTDIAREDQWESDKEAIVTAVLSELVKSVQVPKAATEG